MGLWPRATNDDAIAAVDLGNADLGNAAELFALVLLVLGTFKQQRLLSRGSGIRNNSHMDIRARSGSRLLSRNHHYGGRGGGIVGEAL